VLYISNIVIVNIIVSYSLYVGFKFILLFNNNDFVDYEARLKYRISSQDISINALIAISVFSLVSIWPWFSAFYLYPGTVEKILILFLFISLHTYLKFMTIQKTWLFVLFFSLVLSFFTFTRIQFLTFIPAFIYLLFATKFFTKLIYLIYFSVPILFVTLFHFSVYFNGSYTQDGNSLKLGLFQTLNNNLHGLQYIFFFSFLFTILYQLINLKKRSIFLAPNFWFLLIFFYSFALFFWKSWNYHLSPLAILFSLYFFSLHKRDFVLFSKSHPQLFYLAILVNSIVLFSNLIYNLGPYSSIRAFLLQDDLRDHLINKTVFLDCEEGAIMFPYYLNKYGWIAPKGYSHYFSSYPPHTFDSQSYLLLNESICPFDLESSTFIFKKIWSSSYINSFTLYEVSYIKN
jgi:hypothetical protein